MYINKDLISWFECNRNMIGIIQIFETFLSKFQCILHYKLDGGYIFDKLLSVGCIKIVIIWSFDSRFHGDEIEQSTQVNSIK